MVVDQNDHEVGLGEGAKAGKKKGKQDAGLFHLEDYAKWVDGVVNIDYRGRLRLF